MTDETNQLALEVRLRVWLFRYLANPSLVLLLLLVAIGEAGVAPFLGWLQRVHANILALRQQDDESTAEDAALAVKQ